MSPAREIRAANFRPYERNSLRGFIDLVLPSGLVIREATWHAREGKEWIGLPGKPQTDRDGKQRVHETTGKALYINIIDFASKEVRLQFQAAALDAVHQLVAAGERA